VAYPETRGTWAWSYLLAGTSQCYKVRVADLNPEFGTKRLIRGGWTFGPGQPWPDIKRILRLRRCQPFFVSFRFLAPFRRIMSECRDIRAASQSGCLCPYLGEFVPTCNGRYRLAPSSTLQILRRVPVAGRCFRDTPSIATSVRWTRCCKGLCPSSRQCGGCVTRHSFHSVGVRRTALGR